MMTIVDLVESINQEKKELAAARKRIEYLVGNIKRSEAELSRRPTIAPDVELLATHVIYVSGDWERALRGDGLSQIDCAIADITGGCRILKGAYIGIKSYDRWTAQGADHSYGMCPRHGSVYAQIGLTKEARTRDLNNEEVSASVQYLLAMKEHLALKRKSA